MQAVSIIDLYAFIVNFDFLIGFEIVPDEHFLLATDQRRPDFHGGQPINVNMGNYVTWKIDRNKCDILVPIEMPFASRNNCFRLVWNDVIHNSEIMRGQVPDNADV